MDLAHQAPLSMEFRKQYWSGLPFSSLWDLPTQGSNPSLLRCRQILYYLSDQGNPHIYIYKYIYTHTRVYIQQNIIQPQKKRRKSCHLQHPGRTTRAEKDKHYMISLIYGILKKILCEYFAYSIYLHSIWGTCYTRTGMFSRTCIENQVF